MRVFRTFTPDLHALIDWLLACHIDTVALESTGVYWVPIYELLEQHGIVPYLVNARPVKTVLGRKSDWNDAQWLQKLHALGLLAASFRPDGEIAALRTLVLTGRHKHSDKQHSQCHAQIRRSAHTIERCEHAKGRSRRRLQRHTRLRVWCISC